MDVRPLKRPARGVTAIDTPTPIWKFSAIAVSFVVACFCIGYFVLGPSARLMPGSNAVADGAGDPVPAVITGQVPTPRSSETSVEVEERTEEIEKAKQKAEEERRKAEEEKKAAEEKKKQEEEARKKQEEQSAGSSTTGEGASTDPSGSDNGEEGIPAPDPASYPDGPAVTPPPAPAAPIIKVRVATYDSRSDAQKLAVELNSRGYATVMEPDQQGGRMQYHVQVGAFRDEKTARDLQKELRSNGYESQLVRGR